MGDLDSLKKLFMGLDSGGNSSNDGFAQRIPQLWDGALSSNGRVAARQAGIQKQISSNDKRTASLEDHVAQTEARIRAQYNALDVQMSKLNGLSNYVTTQLAQLNRRLTRARPRREIVGKIRRSNAPAGPQVTRRRGRKRFKTFWSPQHVRNLSSPSPPQTSGPACHQAVGLGDRRPGCQPAPPGRPPL